MSEAGYTLTETLAALTVIGLAMGGMSLGLQVIGRLQLAASQGVARDHEIRASQNRVDDLLVAGAPFRSHESDRFVGTGMGFRFPCGGPDPCEVGLRTQGATEKLRIQSPSGDPLEVALGRPGEARFIYQGSAGPSETWPPQAPERQVLKAISLIHTSSAGERIVLSSRLWLEQPGACAYDAVLRDCR